MPRQKGHNRMGKAVLDQQQGGARLPRCRTDAHVPVVGREEGGIFVLFAEIIAVVEAVEGTLYLAVHEDLHREGIIPRIAEELHLLTRNPVEARGRVGGAAKIGGGKLHRKVTDGRGRVAQQVSHRRIGVVRPQRRPVVVGLIPDRLACLGQSAQRLTQGEHGGRAADLLVPIGVEHLPHRLSAVSRGKPGQILPQHVDGAGGEHKADRPSRHHAKGTDRL